MDLFEDNNRADDYIKKTTPLAERMRPKSFDEFVGQEHLLQKNKPLRLLIENNEVPSIIFWGPPGSGKTTLARLIAKLTQANFFQLNAVSSGVKDVREIIEHAIYNRRQNQKRTILFIDEIHRFNKAQQDALLHSVEDGTITLIAATTENPSFEVISPLLSRCRVYVLEPLNENELNLILSNAFVKDELIKQQNVEIDNGVRETLINFSEGDARIMLNGLEQSIILAEKDIKGKKIITKEILFNAFQSKYIKYDKAGEEHYNVISAFIKSIRGSDPDAAIYWLARMLAAGEDPKFIARRMIILASEDIGNADPYALTLAVSCFSAVGSIGMPEARIVLAQTATYLASVPKSNSSYLAIEEANNDVQKLPVEAVPLNLRNAPTRLMKELEFGKEYKYSHDYKDHFVEQQFLPNNIKDKIYYRPTENGREKMLLERLNKLWINKKR